MKIFNPKRTRYVKVCPKCNSLNIKMMLRSGWFIGLPPSYRCKNCNFKSKFFPEVELEKIKEQFEKENGKK